MMESTNDDSNCSQSRSNILMWHYTALTIVSWEEDDDVDEMK